MFNWLKRRRRKRIASVPWSPVWESIVEGNVRHFHGLSEAERDKLRSITKVIVGEKHWEAHDGLSISDEIKVTIAATAALLLLGVDDYYFDHVRTIIIFPNPIRRETREGPLAGGESHHAGEAWQGGQVVLSWQDVMRDSRNRWDGRNLVIHEFSHCLDGLDGEMGGSLYFPDRDSARRWQVVSEREFRALCKAAREGRPTLLDYYGATNPAEFFAVTCEVFFEQPHELKREHEELFGLLVDYYHLDPTDWI